MNELAIRNSDLPVQKTRNPLVEVGSSALAENENTNSQLSEYFVTNLPVKVKSKELVINGKKHVIDPIKLIRMIKRITQNIGEYKDYDDYYSTVIITALRKARGDIVSVLENQFNINWRIEKGKSTFELM